MPPKANPINTRDNVAAKWGANFPLTINFPNVKKITLGAGKKSVDIFPVPASHSQHDKIRMTINTDSQRSVKEKIRCKNPFRCGGVLSV